MRSTDDERRGHVQLPVVPVPAGEVEVPQPRAAGEQGAARDSASVLRELGLEALVEMLETSGYGICVTGDDHRWVYLNPAGCRLVGRPFAELQGEDYLLSFPEHERGYLLALESDQRAGDDGFYANTLVRPDGTEVGITWSGSVLHAGGKELAPAVFHPTSGLARTDHEVAVPGGSAAVTSSGTPVADVLRGLASEAVALSRAAACLVLVESAEGHLELPAGSGLTDEVGRVVRSAHLRLADLPGGELLTAGRLVVLSDGRARLAAAPTTSRIAEQTAHLSWEGSVEVPLHRAGVVVGCLVLLLPASVTAPTTTELTAWSALGAHASAVLAEERLREQAVAHAAERERHRLGRDLHDSVNAALFALHTRAQAVRRGLDAGDLGVVREAAQQLEDLSRQAVAELRAMVTDMRADPAPAGGLPAALQGLARTCLLRDGLRVHLRVEEPLPHLGAQTSEHLVRVVGEALHNCVKHAGASRADVGLEVRSRELVVTVADDGDGFDIAAASSAGHGLQTMRERALLCGGVLHVDSAPGGGTRVVLRLPLPG